MRSLAFPISPLEISFLLLFSLLLRSTLCSVLLALVMVTFWRPLETAGFGFQRKKTVEGKRFQAWCLCTIRNGAGFPRKTLRCAIKYRRIKDAHCASQRDSWKMKQKLLQSVGILCIFHFDSISYFENAGCKAKKNLIQFEWRSLPLTTYDNFGSNRVLGPPLSNMSRAH